MKGAAVCADEVTRSVWPSGSAFATTPAPSRVLAPGRFSTMTGWPSDADNRSASVRATMSVALPAASVVTIRTLLVGHCWPWAAAHKLQTTIAASDFRIRIEGSRSRELRGSAPRHATTSGRGLLADLVEHVDELQELALRHRRVAVDPGLDQLGR